MAAVFFPKRFPALSHRGTSAGFTYVGLIILVAIINLVALATLQAGALIQRRMAEEELLSIGILYRNALISYANATPVGQQRLPHSLEELLKDPRFPNIRRHLRQRYADPLSGKEEWGILLSPGCNGIAGIYSMSNAVPIKIDQFDQNFADFKGKTSYQDWKFTLLAGRSLAEACLTPTGASKIR